MRRQPKWYRKSTRRYLTPDQERQVKATSSGEFADRSFRIETRRADRRRQD